MSEKPEIIQKDVVIIGAGPAGLSALLWCRDLGLDAVVLEQESEPGGQLLKIHNPITNYLGLTARNGREMRDRFVRHLGELLPTHLISVGASAIDVHEKTVQLTDGRSIRAAAIILATGVRRRSLGIEGETEFRGKGIIESGAKEKESLKGKRVVIVGGGDAALENALILSEYASEVTIVHRRDSFGARPEFVSAAVNDPKIKFVYSARPLAVHGNDRVELIEVADIADKSIKVIPTDAVLIRIGVEANSDLLRAQIPLDDHGYILTNSDCRTNLPGIYAIGDVANPSAPTISTAAGDGASAAKAIYTLVKGG